MNAAHHTKTLTVALLLGLLALGACEKRPTEPATPRAGAAAPAGTLPVTPSAPDPSVPSATSVLSVLSAPATGTAKDEPAAKVGANQSMTRTQESNAMPMPGQVNNHSTTALDPANTRRAASAP